MKRILLPLLIFMMVVFTGNSLRATNIDAPSDYDFKLALAYAASANIDTIYLTTSGGVYTTSDTLYFQIIKPVVIMAKPGLAEMPIFTHSSDDSGTIEMFRVHNDVTFDGVIFDGMNPAATRGLKHAIRFGHGPENQIPRVYAKEGTNIIVKNCVFHDFYDNGDKANEAEGHAIYFLAPGSGEPTLKAGTVRVENCTFYDIGDEAIRMSETEKYAVDRVVDSLIVRNCTFTNISSECIRFYADTDTSTVDAYVLIENLTVNNCGTRMAYIKNNAGAIFRDVLVTNSRLPKLGRAERSDYVMQLQGKGSTVSHVDTINMIFAVPYSERVSCTKGGTVDTTTIYGFDPLYADAANMDYTLTQGSPAYGKSHTDGPLGDLRWVDPTVSVGHTMENVTPDGFTLYQNYPNPFNPATTITYSLAEPGNVTLEIFDITGSRIAVLANGFRNAGTHTVNWQPVNNATGVYFYRLQTAGKSLVRKMMFVR
jgi:hypothetical protein